MHTPFKFISTVLLGLFASQVGAVCNAISQGGSDPELILSITNHGNIGNFTRPDSGDGPAIVTIDRNDTQTVPAAIRLNSNNPGGFFAAKLHVTGGAGCNFQISFSNIGPDLTALDSLANGTLDASGTFDFAIGASMSIGDSGGVGTVSNTFDVTVTYN